MAMSGHGRPHACLIHNLDRVRIMFRLLPGVGRLVILPTDFHIRIVIDAFALLERR